MSIHGISLLGVYKTSREMREYFCHLPWYVWALASYLIHGITRHRQTSFPQVWDPEEPPERLRHDGHQQDLLQPGTRTARTAVA